MSVISKRPTATISRPRSNRSEVSGPLRRIATGALLTAAVISAVVILGAGALLAYGRVAHANTIFTGTSSGGIELGGKSVSEAEAALDARYRTFYARPIPLFFEGTTLNPTPAELGVAVDSHAT